MFRKISHLLLHQSLWHSLGSSCLQNPDNSWPICRSSIDFCSRGPSCGQFSRERFNLCGRLLLKEFVYTDEQADHTAGGQKYNTPVLGDLLSHLDSHLWNCSLPWFWNLTALFEEWSENFKVKSSFETEKWSPMIERAECLGETDEKKNHLYL